MKRILAIKLADLGDLLTITPALRALRNGCPDAFLSALVTPSSASLLQESDIVDEVIPFDKFAFDRKRDAYRGLPRALDLARQLRDRKVDTLVLFHHLATGWGRAKYAALALASGAPERVGLDNGTGWFLTRRATDRGFGVRHEVDYWLDVAALVGGRNTHPYPELVLRAEHTDWARQRWAGLGMSRPAAVIHPGSGTFSTARRWPVERFAEVARRLRAELGLDIVALAGPAPAERDLAEALQAAVDSAQVVADVPSPRHLAAFLQHAAVVIGNDSGVLHLASVVKRPIVAVFGPTNDRAWGPYPPDIPRHQVVRETLACRPCVHRAFSFGTPEGCPARTCLQLIRPDAVIQAVYRALETNVPQITISL
ncbi:MAG: glycosyltransferase family 9 protein [Chloroflexota bacterium]